MNSITNRSGNGPPNHRSIGRRQAVAETAERYIRVADKVEACIAALRAGDRPVEILRRVRETTDRDLNYVMFPILEAAQWELVLSSASRRWDGPCE